MNKSKISLYLVLLIILIAGVYYWNKSKTVESPLGADPQNTTYVVENQTVKLVNGKSEVKASADSASTIITTAFGEPTYGDLDGDGVKDSVMFLTQSTGGSGTFYYAAISLNKGGQYEGLNAVLLGDRIAPQTVLIKDGVAIVNYADRKKGDPMTTQPSVGVSKYLVIEDGKIKEITGIQPGDLVFTGGLVMGDEVRTFTPCGGSEKWVIGSSTAYKKLMDAYQNRQLGTNPYEPLYSVLIGKIVSAPTDGFGKDYDSGIEVSNLIKTSSTGKCSTN